ncbi:stage III sporulation protein AG [Bacillus sp. FJAT-42315]|uniref:stage III sporulation protein AG n=1 Tax=Bacillus sp. FJAT-42315 TaxID=2014077 RepID=UPI001E5756A0|nr:stage III sporulation protein AG [Bacillus sp. FJAT-42315]
MSDRKNLLERLQSLIPSKKSGEEKTANKAKWMVIVAILGMGMMLFSDLKERGDIPVINQDHQANSEEASGQKNSPIQPSTSDYEQEYEKKLQSALEEMAGVSNVTVVVNIEASEQKVLEKNTAVKSQETKEIDKKGGERTVIDQTREEELVMMKEEHGDAPVILEMKKPEIRGVLVVAEGVENIQVKKWVIESVTRVLHVPSHRVAVMPKKPKEEA